MSSTKTNQSANKVNSSIVKETSDFRPMLLALGEIDKMDKFPYILQNKYDGVRCIAIKGIDSVVKTFSRDGNEFSIPHVKEAVSKVFERFPMLSHLDGEIYQHGVILETISGLVKRHDDSLKVDLYYQIYDIPLPDTTMENRMSLLGLIEEFTIEAGIQNVIKCDTGAVAMTQAEVTEFYEKALKNGYEGAVATRADSFYKTDTRSVLKLKLKPAYTDEFICVGHYYGNGKCSDMSTLIVASKKAQALGYASAEVFESFSKTKTKKFITENYFHVKMNGSNERRIEMAKNFDVEFRNKPITVEYYSLSNNDIPRGGKGVAVRDYE